MDVYVCVCVCVRVCVHILRLLINIDVMWGVLYD